MKIKKYPTVLLIISLVICISNYSFGTFLMGFDSLHQEFDLGLSFTKSLSIWQEHIGLGAQGNMSYASDLSKTFILSLLSVAFPISLLRYLWVFGNLILGVIGMYYFLLGSGIFAKQKSRQEALSFFGALFYLFNLSTLQLFYVNFDGFVTQFGFLPWIFLVTKNLFEKGSKKNWLIFFLLSLLSSLQAYTGTLFIAFLVYFSIYLFFIFLVAGPTKANLAKSSKIFSFYLLINMYWLWSIIYFVIKGAGFISSTSINYFSSEESFLLNQKFGSVINNLELRGFWFQTTDYFLDSQEFRPLLGIWESHLNQPWNLSISWVLITIVVLGFLKTFFDRKLYAYGVFFFISLFFLSAGNFPFELLFNFFRDYVPLFKEALRFPYTKFSVLASFTYSVLFSIGILYLWNLLSKFSLAEKLKFLKKLNFTSENFLVVLVLSLFVFRFLPYFQGELINPRMRVSIPDEYFKVFEYFKNKGEQGRVYLAPANTFWAWSYYSWGYRGSGFLGYGLKQPLIDRSFDAMNRDNEEVYWEMFYGIQKKDPKIIQNVVRKYGIKWMVLDNYVIRPGVLEEKDGNNEVLLKLLSENSLIQEYRELGNIKVVELSEDTSFLKNEKNLAIVSADDQTSFYDPVFETQNNYILKRREIDQKMIDVYFPYSYLYSIRGLQDFKYKFIKDNQQNTYLKLEPFKRESLFLDKFYTQNNKFYLNNNQGLRIIPMHFGTGTYNVGNLKDYTHLYFNNRILNIQEASGQKILKPTENFYLLGGLKQKDYYFNNLFASDLDFDTCLNDYESGNYSYKLEGGTMKVTAFGKISQICLFGKLARGVFSPQSFVSIDLKGIRSDLDFEDTRFCLIKSSNYEKCFMEGFLDNDKTSINFYNDIDSGEYALYLYFSIQNSRNNLVYQISDLVTVSEFTIYEPASLIFTPTNLNLSDILDTYVPLNSEIAFLNNSYTNLCGDGVIRLTSPEIKYSSEYPKCLNLGEKIKNDTSEGIYNLEYRLQNSPKKPLICSATRGGCLISEKLSEQKSNYVGLTNNHFQTIRLDLESYSSNPSNISLDKLSFYDFDIDQFGKTYLLRDKHKSSEFTPTSSESRVFNWLYIVKSPEIGFLSLNQGRDPGWIAWCGNSLCDLVGFRNAWGMTWKIESNNSSVILIYWPQLIFVLFIILNAIIFCYLFTFLIKSFRNKP